MYSDYKPATFYYDSPNYQDQHKRPKYDRFEHRSPHQKAHLSKTLRWNIEESKENAGSTYDQSYPSVSTHLSRTQFSNFNSSSYNTRKEVDRPFTEYSKSKFSKSYKSIRHELDSDYDYTKTFTSTTKGANLYQKSPAQKGLTMSLGFKSNLNDLVNYNYEGCNANDRLKQSVHRTLKPSKSERRINIQSEEMRLRVRDNRDKIQPTQKSYKNIEDIIAEARNARKEERNIQPFSSNKSTRDITTQDIMRLKNDKLGSFIDPVDLQIQISKMKKHHTMGGSRPFSTKEIEYKHKMSINDFQLGACKGEGAFGQVFPAIHKATKMLVAIKKVPKEKVKYMLDQFINEIKIQMFLDHPNIVKLYGFFDDSLHFYIVMQYMEGGNVYGLIKKKKRLSETETAERLKEICLGLKEMHDNSILHRDIKPQNIVITNDVCKLCDFGWSAICKDRRTTYCGTLDYVSPQLIEGEGYDDSVDIWCIGVLCYQMICGKTPFYNISRKETMKKIANVTYDYPAQITPASKGFIDRILKKNPDDRIGIDEVLKDKFLSQ